MGAVAFLPLQGPGPVDGDHEIPVQEPVRIQDLLANEAVHHPTEQALELGRVHERKGIIERVSVGAIGQPGRALETYPRTCPRETETRSVVAP